MRAEKLSPILSQSTEPDGTSAYSEASNSQACTHNRPDSSRVDAFLPAKVNG
jgi:hypothetical protein